MLFARRVFLSLLCAMLAAVTGATPASGGAAGASTTASSAKKGLASATYIWRDPAKLDGLGLRWVYGWSPWVPASTARIESVPMVWGRHDLTPSVLRHLTASAREGHYRALLGFNEPDWTAQANLPPGQAADAWPLLQRTGLRLGSPAPAVWNDGWLDRFMHLAAQRHLRVDFIALHFYLDFTDPGAVSGLRRVLETVHRRYGRPIWITELGSVDIRDWHQPMAHRPSAALAATFMRSVVRMLDGLPYVQRYAWFSDDLAADPTLRWSSLFDRSGRLTALGALYRALR